MILAGVDPCQNKLDVAGNRFFTDSNWTNEIDAACNQNLNFYCFGELPSDP